MTKCLVLAALLLALAILLAAANPSAAYPPNDCVGDCDQDQRVTIDELVTGVHDALGPEVTCEALDCNQVGGAFITCLIFAVDNAMSGCPPLPPTPTPNLIAE